MSTNETPQLYEINLRDVYVTASGITSLICHRFGEEAQRQIEAKQQKQATTAKAARDPEAEFRSALYILPDGGYGFPAVAFKNAMVSACRYLDMKMTVARGSFHVLGDLLPIRGGEPVMRSDRVVIGRGITNIAYRPEFLPPWEIDLRIRYNTNVISAEQIVNQLEMAGFAVGVGDWRPECNGNHGMFEVKREREDES